MLSFSLVAEALTGLIYHRPSGENSKFLPGSARKCRNCSVVVSRGGLRFGFDFEKLEIQKFSNSGVSGMYGI